MPYEWATRWSGVLERHADSCPFRDGEMCACGPLGYAAVISDPDTGETVSSPLLETAEEARAWRREQGWAVDPEHSATSNGKGAPPRVARASRSSTPTIPAAVEHRGPPDYEAPRRASTRNSREPPVARRRAADDSPEPPGPRRSAAEDSRGPPNEIPPAPIDERDVLVSTLIDGFLDAAEDGEARGHDGRPYSDDELAELEWALAGYVESHIGHLDASTVRGRHIFWLIDELEDANLPRSRLLSVIDAIRELFSYAADRELVRVNPAEYISMPADDLHPQPRRQARVQETLETRAERPPADRGSFDNLVSEQTIWMLVKIVALVFVCIALVLVAESV